MEEKVQGPYMINWQYQDHLSGELFDVTMGAEELEKVHPILNVDHMLMFTTFTRAPDKHDLSGEVAVLTYTAINRYSFEVTIPRVGEGDKQIALLNRKINILTHHIQDLKKSQTPANDQTMLKLPLRRLVCSNQQAHDFCMSYYRVGDYFKNLPTNTAKSKLNIDELITSFLSSTKDRLMFNLHYLNWHMGYMLTDQFLPIAFTRPTQRFQKYVSLGVPDSLDAETEFEFLAQKTTTRFLYTAEQPAWFHKSFMVFFTEKWGLYNLRFFQVIDENNRYRPGHEPADLKAQTELLAANKKKFAQQKALREAEMREQMERIAAAAREEEERASKVAAKLAEKQKRIEKQNAAREKAAKNRAVLEKAKAAAAAQGEARAKERQLLKEAAAAAKAKRKEQRAAERAEKKKQKEAARAQQRADKKAEKEQAKKERKEARDKERRERAKRGQPPLKEPPTPPSSESEVSEEEISEPSEEEEKSSELSEEEFIDIEEEEDEEVEFEEDNDDEEEQEDEQEDDQPNRKGGVYGVGKKQTKALAGGAGKKLRPAQTGAAGRRSSISATRGGKGAAVGVKGKGKAHSKTGGSQKKVNGGSQKKNQWQKKPVQTKAKKKECCRASGDAEGANREVSAETR